EGTCVISRAKASRAPARAMMITLRRALLRTRAPVQSFATATVNADTGLPDIIITPFAAQKLKETAMKQKRDEIVLRVGVEGGGCSGFKYTYEFENNEVDEEEDVYANLFEQHGGKVVVDKESLDLIRGSTVDYEQELIRSAFVIVNNPNAASGCGCGSSFDLKD
ncbi:TPA: hypothetical protein N0F65_008397, partial [Lagenidium giganteum]